MSLRNNIVLQALVGEATHLAQVSGFVCQEKNCNSNRGNKIEDS